MLTIEHEKGESSTSAIDIEAGELFRDSDRELYIRLVDGALDLSDQLCYSDDELNEFNAFKQCWPVKGKVDIKVTLEGAD